MKLNIFAGVQKGIQGIQFVQKGLKAIGKINDDLDGDGKSQLQNICEKAEALISDAIFQFKELSKDVKDILDLLKVKGGAIVVDAHALFDHVLKDEDKK